MTAIALVALANMQTLKVGDTVYSSTGVLVPHDEPGEVVYIDGNHVRVAWAKYGHAWHYSHELETDDQINDRHYGHEVFS